MVNATLHLQCNNFKQGHPNFLANYKDDFKIKDSEFVSFSDQSQPRQYGLLTFYNVSSLHSNMLNIMNV